LRRRAKPRIQQFTGLPETALFHEADEFNEIAPLLLSATRGNTRS
jgi:hypothetical protein